jgi:hypothetical protein
MTRALGGVSSGEAATDAGIQNNLLWLRPVLNTCSTLTGTFATSTLARLLQAC